RILAIPSFRLETLLEVVEVFLCLAEVISRLMQALELDADHRLAGSLVLAMKGVEQGCQLLRVHDVAETRQALSVAMALGGAD
ncbi:MAG: hypothetical protein ACPF9Y_03990, partial [Candidatus Puniceispirillaceae bacterium]